MSGVYPPNDLWCELLEHVDGSWHVMIYGNKAWLGVNVQDYKVGALSLEAMCEPSPYITNLIDLILPLNEGRELNLTDVKLLEFWAKMTKLGEDGGFDPALTVILYSDVPSVSAWKIFPISGTDWQHISSDVGPEAEYQWIVDAGFDWTRIVEIRFLFNQFKGGSIQYFRLDGILFHFLQDVSLINVESNPFSGVPVRLNGAFTEVTPIMWVVDPPSVREVTVASIHEGWKFDRWHDGLKTPGRIVDATTPGLYKLTAFYLEPTPPPNGIIPPLRRFWEYVDQIRRYLRSLRRR